MKALGLFEGFGIELEYMIVRADDLSIAPVADEVLKDMAGEVVSEVAIGPIAWCNELVLHVIELKTNGPAASLDGLEALFQEGVGRVNRLLAPRGCCLLPTAMHPWMDPDRETRLWPHDYSVVYESYHRIFGCRGHGWSNLQSLHMNLPFADGDEFGRLHAAIRLILPIMPALAASSPVVEGRVTGLADNRLAKYRLNQQRIPSIAGDVIPEPVFSPEEYQECILGRIYQDIAPHDPEGILQFEWLNSRGAIARFDRNTIEVRVLDLQESPKADLAIYRLIVEALTGLVEERWTSYGSQKAWPVASLLPILEGTIAEGGQFGITNRDYLSVLGFPAESAMPARELWRRLFRRFQGEGRLKEDSLEVLLQKGSLSERIVDAIEHGQGRDTLQRVYRGLAETLRRGELFDAENSLNHHL